MRDSSQKDAGLIQALMIRLETQRLPRALALKSKVDRGERLDELDTKFLHQAFEDAGTAQKLAAKHAEFQPLVAKLIDLYGEITGKGLANEQKENGRVTAWRARSTNPTLPKTRSPSS